MVATSLTPSVTPTSRSLRLLTRPSATRPALSLACGVAIIYVALLRPGIYSIDANSMLAVAEALVHDRSFQVSAAFGQLGRGGHYYSIWYPLQSIAATPFVAMGSALSHITGLPSHYLSAALAPLVSIISVSLTTYFVYLTSIRIGSDRTSAYIAAISFAFGTIALHYGRDFYTDPLLALLTILCVYSAMSPRDSIRILTLPLMTLMILTKPISLFVGVVIAIYFAYKRYSVRDIVAPLAGIALGALAYGAYDYLRFVDVLETGDRPGFDVSVIPAAVIGFLISPGRGIIWYCPPVLALIFVRRSRWLQPEALLLVAVSVGYFAIYCVWSDWPGGWSWGPRLLFPVLPGIFVMIGSIGRRGMVALAFLTVAGFVVQVPTIISFYERYYEDIYVLDTGKNLSESFDRSIWTFGGSPLVNTWRTSREAWIESRAVDVSALVRQANTSDGRSQWRSVVGLWWWMLPAAGIPRWCGALLSVLAIFLGVLILAYPLAYLGNQPSRSTT